MVASTQMTGAPLRLARLTDCAVEGTCLKDDGSGRVEELGPHLRWRRRWPRARVGAADARHSHAVQRPQHRELPAALLCRCVCLSVSDAAFSYASTIYVRDLRSPIEAARAGRRVLARPSIALRGKRDHRVVVSAAISSLAPPPPTPGGKRRSAGSARAARPSTRSSILAARHKVDPGARLVSGGVERANAARSRQRKQAGQCVGRPRIAEHIATRQRALRRCSVPTHRPASSGERRRCHSFECEPPTDASIADKVLLWRQKRHSQAPPTSRDIAIDSSSRVSDGARGVGALQRLPPRRTPPAAGGRRHQAASSSASVVQSDMELGHLGEGAHTCSVRVRLARRPPLERATPGRMCDPPSSLDGGRPHRAWSIAVISARLRQLAAHRRPLRGALCRRRAGVLGAPPPLPPPPTPPSSPRQPSGTRRRWRRWSGGGGAVALRQRRSAPR